MPEEVDLQRILSNDLPLDTIDVVDNPGTVIGFTQTIKARVGGHLYQVRIIFYPHRGGFDITDFYFAQFSNCLRHCLHYTRPLIHETRCCYTTGCSKKLSSI